jgi:hypothetical protein
MSPDTEQIVVLGWDALDIELLEHHSVADAFGSHRAKVKTYDNEVCGKPHTLELWPSMITGLTPPEHGIRAISESDGVDWQHPALNMISTLANGVVPDRILTSVGAWLQDRGAGIDQMPAGEYRQKCLDTVFTDADRPISIPNYRTDYDRRHDLDAARNSLWAALDVDRSGDHGIEPQVDHAAVQQILGEAYGRRVGHTLHAMQAGTPLVWTWFGLLDSIGHMAPTMEYPLERQGYRTASAVTELIRETAPPETTVVSISDHGLQDGHHTHYATVASDRRSAVETVGACWEIADWIRSVNPGGRSAASEGATQSHGEMAEQLEALGYV